MTHSHPRDPAPPETLHGLRLDPSVRYVTDELAALHIYDPSDADYATFFRDPPLVASVVDRARHHASQVQRFLALLNNSAHTIAPSQLSQLYALTLLNGIATVAAALIPARAGADRHAQRQQGAAFLGTLEDGKNNELYDVGEIAFGLHGIDAAVIAQDAIAFAARGHGEPSPTSRATLHVLEEHATLSCWLRRKTNIPGLFVEADNHAQMANRFAKALDEDEFSPRARDAMIAAREGALLQNAIVLAEIALSTADVDTDAIFETAHESLDRRVQAKAALLIAIAMGKHMRAMMAAHLF